MTDRDAERPAARGTPRRGAWLDEPPEQADADAWLDEPPEQDDEYDSSARAMKMRAKPDIISIFDGGPRYLPKPCGTKGWYRRHVAIGEPIDSACEEWRRNDELESAERSRQRVTARIGHSDSLYNRTKSTNQPANDTELPHE